MVHCAIQGYDYYEIFIAVDNIIFHGMNFAYTI